MLGASERSTSRSPLSSPSSVEERDPREPARDPHHHRSSDIHFHASHDSGPSRPPPQFTTHRTDARSQQRIPYTKQPAMSSGYGMNGGPSRCFPFWQEVLACYVVNSNEEDSSGKKKCAPMLEDYYECLHHKKEAARVQALQAAYRKAEAEGGYKANPPTAGQIRNLGILGKEEDSRAVLTSK